MVTNLVPAFSNPGPGIAPFCGLGVRGHAGARGIWRF